MKDNFFKFSPSVILLPFLFVLSIWTVFWLEIKFGFKFTDFGINPRDYVGLRGVFFSPFLHGDANHLYNNTIPVFLLLVALRYFYRDQFYKILLFGILCSGILTWLIGRKSYHIGASGLIYVLVSFIFFKGIITGYFRLIALSLLVVMIYGGLVWYIFPGIKSGISWEGHLSGLLTGILFAIFLKTQDYKKAIKYDWEHPDFDPTGDKFLERFDENGNFVNLPKPEILVVEDDLTLNHTTQNSIIIKYHYVENSLNKNPQTE